MKLKCTKCGNDKNFLEVRTVVYKISSNGARMGAWHFRDKLPIKDELWSYGCPDCASTKIADEDIIETKKPEDEIDNNAKK